MMDNEEKKEKLVEKEHVTGASCCSFSNTEALLKKLLGDVPQETPPEMSDVSCGCGCETHLPHKEQENVQDPKEIKQFVKERYASLITNRGSSCCGPSTSNPVNTQAFEIDLGDKKKYVENLGYTEDELQNLPSDVTEISFGCGNPTAIAELKPGEIVLDLGSGGGIDVFLSAKKVGPSGKAIGLDITPEMIERANANAAKMGITNVEFKLGEMENIPLLDDSVDVVISNCVINLSPDKGKVFRQIFRVLKPGGRLAVSDIVLNGQLPTFIKQDFEAWAGCIAGALQEGDYLQKIKDAGFEKIEIQSKTSARELAFSIKQDPKVVEQLIKETGCTPEELLDRIVSIKVKATKPI